MDTTFTARSKYRPAPGTQARRETDWTVMSNETLKFALDNASLHNSPYEIEIMREIQKRIERGAWLDIDQHVPIHAPDVPGIFYVFPFSLLWRQHSRK
jgi:hypothetical protein